MKKMSLVLAAMMAISLFLPGMALADDTTIGRGEYAADAGVGVG